MKACYAEQVRNIDRLAYEEGSIPSVVLMENAALSCVDAVIQKFGSIQNRRIGIFCGKGNNGGDGFAIARHLTNHGAVADVFLVCGDEFRGDALINFEIVEKTGINIEHLYNSDMMEYVIPSYDIVIDAIYGTGIHGEIEGLSAEIIDKINDFSKYTVSVDIPSGLNADTGEICGVCVRADMTVTFAAYKMGMFLYPGADMTGEVILSKISIPDYILNMADTAAEIMDDNEFASRFPKRCNDSQKGDYGKVLVIGGSLGMSGAAYMSGTAALNSGSGLVTLAVPECINAILETKTTEIMTVPIADRDGRFSGVGAVDIIKCMEKADAVLIGPGMGIGTDSKIILEEVLKASKVPVIVDADALNILSNDMSILEKCTCDLIFTPHEMEMSRLTGTELEQIRKNRINVSRRFAEKYGVTLILKGHHTIVAAPDGLQYINNTGNSGLAKGGSGDVLAGIAVSFAARGVDTVHSAAMAAYLHGRAADRVMEKCGIESVTGSSVINEIGATIRNICTRNYR